MPQPEELIAEEAPQGLPMDVPDEEAPAPELVPEEISQHCALALQEIEVF